RPDGPMGRRIPPAGAATVTRGRPGPCAARSNQMQLGFVSAILPELSLEEVAGVAVDAGYDCVEVMCWPPGKAERRYAGVTHLDVTNFNDDTAAHVRDLVRIHGVKISGLGYY